jgi:hypothetical protein
MPTQPAALWSTRLLPYFPIMPPTITKDIVSPSAPAMSRGRRPTLSIKNTAGSVLRQFTIPYTPVAKSEVYDGKVSRFRAKGEQLHSLQYFH